MAVRLNITIDDDVYDRLKRELRPKEISRFIYDAIRSRLRPSVEDLDRGYQAAACERWRRSMDEDWAVTEVEKWPE